MKKFDGFLNYAKKIPARKYGYFFLFVLVVYLGLVLFQLAIITCIIPQDFTLNYLYLNVTDPNPSSMFFNNFMHNPLAFSHLTNNVQTLLFLIVLVFIMGVVVLPASGYQLPKHFFSAIFVIFLAGLPFALSGISIWAGRIFDKIYISGFSGINFALFGLFFFLLLLWFYSALLKERHDRPLTPYVLLFATVFIMGLVIFMILLDLANPLVGVYSHLGGFLLGLIIPALVGMVLLSESRDQKVVLFILLFTILGGCASFWMIL